VFFVYLAAAENPWSIDGGYPTSRQVLRIGDFWWEGVHSSSYPVLPGPTHCLFEMEDEFWHKELGAQLLLLDVGW